MRKQNTSYWNKQNKKIEICETPIWFMVLTFAPVNSASPELCRNLFILFKLFFKQFWNSLNFVSNNKQYLQNLNILKNLHLKIGTLGKQIGISFEKILKLLNHESILVNESKFRRNSKSVFDCNQGSCQSGYSWNFLF